MKKRKVEIVDQTNNIYEDNLIRIDIEDSGEYYFEIKGEITNDLGEAVAIMMRIRDKWNDSVWNTEIPIINTYEKDTEKSLYWLSGGHDEWRKLENYKKNWYESSLIFREEYGMMIISILKKSKTLKEIRDGFNRYLNLDRLYDFAIEKNIA